MLTEVKREDSDSLYTDTSSVLSKPLPPLPQKSRASWSRLFAFTKRSHYHVLAGALLASMAVAGIQTALAAIIGRIFDVVAGIGSGAWSGHEALESVSRWCLVLVGLGFANWFANTALLGLWVAFGELQAHGARRRVFGSLLVKHMTWFDRLEQGMPGLLSRIQTQTRELQSATGQVLGFLICDSLAAFASLAVAMYHSWKLTLVLLATIPFSVAILSFATRRLDPAIQSQKARLERAAKLARASLAAIDVVKVFNGSERELAQYRDALGLARVHFLIQARCNSVQMGYVAFWVVSLFVMGFWYGVSLVRNGLAPGNVVTTFYSTLAAFQAAEALSSNWLILSKGVAAGSFLARMTDDKADEDDEVDGGRIRLGHCVGDVQFTDVSFAYPSNPAKRVLKQASFVFPAGQTTFVVGPSGCGKSTVGSLLANLYQPLSGSVSIDGQRLERLEASWVRDNVTLIQQESIVFRDSLYNNVALGHANPDSAPEEQVMAACQSVLLQSTIASLPHGLETEVGSGAVALSGGQKQRVALARAYLKDPTVLVLDEVTSELDQVSRNLVMDAVREWRRDKTTVIITHDVSCIGDNDYVYVMDDATVARQGFKRDMGDYLGWPINNKTNDKTDNPEDDDISPTSADPNPNPDPDPDPRRTSLLSPRLRTGHRMSLPPLRLPTYDTEGGAPAFVFGTAEGRQDISRLRQTPGREAEAAAKRDEEKALEYQDQNQINHSAFSKHTSLISILRTLWPSLHQSEKTKLVVGLTVCLLGAAATPAFALCLSQLMSVMWSPSSPGESTSEARKWALVLAAVAVMDGLATGIGRYLVEAVAQCWIDGVRSQAMTSILQQTKPWHLRAQNAPARLAECLDRNGEEMRAVVGRFIPILIFVITIMTLSVSTALATDWRLTLVALSPMPVIALSVRAYAAVGSAAEVLCGQAADDTSAVATESLLSIRFVRALGLSSRQSARHAKSTDKTLSLGIARAKRTCYLFGLYQSMSYAVSALIFYYGTLRLTSSSPAVDATSVLRVITLLLFGIGTSTEMLDGLPQLALAQAAAGPLLHLASLPAPKKGGRGRHHRKQAVDLPLRINNITFSHPTSLSPTLSNLSLIIPPNQITAIAGPSGSGKSTLLSLLLGLYPNDQSPTSTSTALIPQSPPIFPTTIAQNILYGISPQPSPSSAAAALEASSRAVALHAFIASLPRGYATLVGDGGQALSGGQAQRLAIARALVRRPRLIVADEPTSSLDAYSARAVSRAFRDAAREGAAVVVATHCPEMMRAADRVVVLGRGFVVEEVKSRAKGD
ncbi:ABC a-pheromone efflux pump AtrD [Ophiocordyceps camponoti-floridani]|uniref:ABC a-pheromone efflux pump AtrD n=1 Tax=Ophiocordyceps camponoti-floridani TaxID=2030778 RepID=A0A8H4VFX4_9HYPO|nr:ABC a-pheromone efflux pump AtrD [Ophiocordyceps camponoti-floridani]